MIQFHNPEADVAVEAVPYDLSVDVRGKSVDIGFLANGFPDAEPFLGHLADALQALEPGIRVHAVNKGNPTVPAGEGLLGGLKACAGVVAAYGH